MTFETEQRTLSGDTTSVSRAATRPRTLVYCGECDEYLLRSSAVDHDHPVIVDGRLRGGGA